MLSTYCVFGVSDAVTASAMLGAYQNDVTVEITYLPLKSPPPGPPPAPFVQVVTVPAFTSLQVPINVASPQFAGGYGAVQLRSVDPQAPQTPSQIPFFAYCSISNAPDVNPVSGSSFVGTRFRVPLQPCSRVKMVVTNVDSVPGNVSVLQPGAANNLATQSVASGATWLWDSSVPGWTVDFTREIEACSDGIRFVASAILSMNHQTLHLHLPTFC
jgi:hypothetical protein